MKALILALALALASTGHAFVLNTTAVEKLNEGMGGTPYGTLTYALNNSLTGTSSSAVDLSGTAGLWLSITTTANPKVDVYFSNSNVTYTTGAYAMYTITAPGSYAIAPKARYVSFYNSGTQPAGRVSAFYYTVAPANNGNTGAGSAAAGIAMLNAGFYDISITAATGLTLNAGVTRSITSLAGTATGTGYVKLLDCAGMTTAGYLIHSTATPPGLGNTPLLTNSFICGTTSIAEMPVNLASSPHITFYAKSLTGTSGVFGFEVLTRSAQ